MNPSLKLLLIIIISLEISFTTKLFTNLILIAVTLVVLIIHRTRPQTFLKLILVPILPAIAIATTIRWFSPGHSTWLAIVMVSRLYAYCLLGALIFTIDTPLQLAQSLEQNAHLPAKFAYGTLAAINIIPRTIQTVKTIRLAAQMRNVSLHFWSPQLYFKAILSALSWSDHLAQAMESQGFNEQRLRTHTRLIKLTITDWSIFVISLVGIQLTLLMLP
ncbi:energy-coupling factor transporter transmembrane protein EcfT [uncultured Limosilactobacillus sp.]|uniref:energy-coupling factor transporter transmembrane component T family protein n=1 Tax=uncultured Limosilactobacillus sp. TaxID=2837629 RepID=UPI0025E2B8C3|nr:energy-coupling factor transporter transmembrane component T [uncultured Limosilactobacillus sp.]